MNSVTRSIVALLASTVAATAGAFLACGDTSEGGSSPDAASGLDATTTDALVSTNDSGEVLDSSASNDASVDAAKCLGTGTATLADGGPFFVPSPYVQASDSPFYCEKLGYFYLATFEGDGGLPPGVVGNLGKLTFPPGTLNALTDSVDGDDGIPDGGPDGATYPCERCNSWFNGSGATGVEYTFDETALGGLPTRVGLVWTDGSGNSTVTFEAYGADGGLMATQVATGIGDNSNFGTTAEDRFFGISTDAGVKKIKMHHPGGGIEVDHLQYGR